MSTQPPFGWLQVRQTGPAMVVRFAAPRLDKEATVEMVAEELFELADGSRGCRLVLDFSSVDRVYSGMLAKMVALRQHVEAAGGAVALCALRPELVEVLEATRLDTIFSIYPDEQAALQARGDE